MKTLLIISIAFNFLWLISSNIRKIKPVTVFSSDEKDLHKYAAILAATEPYRLQRDSDIKSALNPLMYWFHKVKGTKFNDHSCIMRLENKDIDLACARYERKADEIVRSYGLNVNSFNSLSRKITGDSSLRQRVLLQSYYYRIAADLEDNLKPQGLPILNTNLGSTITRDVYPGNAVMDASNSKLYRFAQALRAVEDERLKQRNSIQEELRLPSLPNNMCDPASLPAMSRCIQTACAEFPKIALQIVTQYGLEPEDFNELDAKMKTDALFRFRVRKEVEKVDKLGFRARRK